MVDVKTLITLNLVTSYEGRVVSGDVRFVEDMALKGQLLGELADSGIFPLNYNHDKNVGELKLGGHFEITLSSDLRNV